MHKNGQGCERNEKKAFEWYHKAAKRGHSLAQYNLGILYGKGAGVAQNDREALHWLEKAAGADVEAAQPAIAELKRLGELRRKTAADTWINKKQAKPKGRYGHDDFDDDDNHDV
jgi:TPR repeat protein